MATGRGRPENTPSVNKCADRTMGKLPRKAREEPFLLLPLPNKIQKTKYPSFNSINVLKHEDPFKQRIRFKHKQWNGGTEHLGGVQTLPEPAGQHIRGRTIQFFRGVDGQLFGI